MDDDFKAELSKILQRGSREGDEEALLRLTKRVNEILLDQDEKQRQSSQSGDAEYSRKNQPLVVIIDGRDKTGHEFTQKVLATNLSQSGGLLSGITKQVRAGDLIWVEHRGKKSRFKVVWVRDSESHQLIQAAIHLLKMSLARGENWPLCSINSQSAEHPRMSGENSLLWPQDQAPNSSRPLHVSALPRGGTSICRTDPLFA
jgi:hypothetical protein